MVYFYLYAIPVVGWDTPVGPMRPVVRRGGAYTLGRAGAEPVAIEMREACRVHRGVADPAGRHLVFEMRKVDHEAN